MKALLVLVSGAIALAQPPSPIEAELKTFTEAYAAIETNAADAFEPRPAYFGGAIPAMLRKLDPFSVFLDPNQTEQLKQMQQSERKGFGSVVSVLPGRVIVLQTLPGTPSAKAGLSPGDEIMAINNVVLARLDFDQLVQLLSEARQKQARIAVRRPGSLRLLDFTLSPELMDSPSVDRAYLLKPGYGYVRAASFDNKTGAELKTAIESIGGRQLKGLVIDLRNNPGGVVEAALASASLFLKSGQTILSVRGRATPDDSVKVPEKNEPYDFPMAVLINGKSASAAEIVTGALQDNHRARIVGEPSYGKGLVQSVYTLASNTALALTTAFYYTPSGRSIQRPLAGGQLNPTKYAGKGHNGSGIDPDDLVHPEGLNRLRAAVEASGSLTSFGTTYLRAHKIAPTFQVPPALLDEFKLYLAENNIQPSTGEWAADRAWMEQRLTQELIGLSFGVAKGDEVEARYDPVVQRALAGIER